MSFMKASIRRYTHCLLVAAAMAASLSALADQTWKGTSNNQWNVGGNWSGGLPGPGDAVIYNNLSTLNLNGILGQDFTVRELVLSNVPGPVAIGGLNTLTLAPTSFDYTNVVGTTTNGFMMGIRMTNAVQNLTISAPVALGAHQCWAVTNNQWLDVAGPISGSFGLYKDGAGALTLEGTNSFTGGFTNNGGAVWINNSAALGTTSKNVWLINNALGAGLHLNGTNGDLWLPAGLQFNLSQNLGAIFNEAGSNTLNGNIYVQQGGGSPYLVVNGGSLTLNGLVGLSVTARPIQVGGPGNGTINGQVTAALSVLKTDGGTWTLNNKNDNYSGLTTIQGGTLALGTNATIPNTPAIILQSNAVLDVSVVSNATYQSVGFYLNSGYALPAQTLSGDGSVLGNVLAYGPGALSPGGTNTPGTLNFSNNLSLSSISSIFELNTPMTPGAGINDLVNIGGDLDPVGATVSVTALSQLTSPGTYRLFNYSGAELNPIAYASLQTDTRYTLTLDDSVPHQINLLVSGGNVNLVWSGDNGATWDYLYNASPNWNSDSEYFYNADRVTFDDTSANNVVEITGTVRPLSVSVANNSLGYSWVGPGKVTGATGVNKSGSGTLVVFNNNDFTGPVTVSGGVLCVTNFQKNGTASPLGAGTNITLDGGTFQFGGARPNASTVNRYWTLGPNGGTILSTNATFFLANQVSGPGSLTKTGTAQLILGDINTGVASPGASNTYSGNTYILQGELQIRNNHALGFGKAVVSNGADLAFGGGVNYGTLTNAIDLNGGDGKNNSGTLEVNDSNTSATYGGTINLLADSSVGSFNAPSSFIISGPIIGPGLLKKLNHVNCTVILTCPTNSYSGGTSNVSGGTLQLGNGGVCGSLGTGPVANNGTLAYNHSDNVTNNLAISGTGSLTHAGSGTLTLGGANSYSGTTAVNGGTLVVNGALAGGAVTVANKAILGGYGTIGGPVTINSGGTLALGAGIGALTINNALNLGGTNIMKVTHGANDKIQGLSTVSFGGALTITVVGSVQAGDSFKLFDASTYAGAFTSTNLPSLGGSLAWDSSGLTNGTLAVISTGVTQPTFNPPYRLGNGQVQLTFSGPSGSSYRVWATTNLSFTPITSTWSNLTSGQFSSMPVTFTDSQAPSYPRRFYVITIP